MADVFGAAWDELPEAQKRALLDACPEVKAVVLQTALAVARTFKREDAIRLCPKKAERNVLETAARELKLVVLDCAAEPHAMDGRLPFEFASRTGHVGIEVKSGPSTVPTDETEKFLDDLTSKNYAAGLLVSLRSPIAKMPRGLHVERALSATGSAWAVFVSPLPHDGGMESLTRNALSLATLLSESSAPLSGAGTLAERVHGEADALSLVRKRLRDDDALARHRTDRNLDALGSLQQRLFASVSVPRDA